jgi:hypothetical protein
VYLFEPYETDPDVLISASFVFSSLAVLAFAHGYEFAISGGLLLLQQLPLEAHKPGLTFGGWRSAAACSQRPTDKKRQRKPCETWGTASALGRHIEICLVGFLIRR